LSWEALVSSWEKGLVPLAQMFRAAETLIDDRRDISRYPIKDQALVKVNIYEFSFRTRTDDDATHEVENDEGEEEEDDRDGGCPSQPGDLAG
jgi:hypothetical protein